MLLKQKIIAAHLLKRLINKMSNSAFDHIAYATNHTDNSMEIFSILGFKNQLFYKQKIDKFSSYITKLQSATGQVLELVEPYSNQSVVSKILQNQQAIIYHSAFFTADLILTLTQLKKAGAVIITEPMTIPYPASVAHTQYHTSHVFHSHVGLFEVTGPLLEEFKK